MLVKTGILYRAWDDETYEHFRDELLSLSDESYQKFTSNLIPNITKERIIGIRIPLLRSLAKEIQKGDVREYIEQCISRHKENPNGMYLEETMLFGFVIAGSKNIKELMKYADFFVTQIDNWSVCDSFCTSLKLIREHREYCLEYIQRWIASEQEYVQRAAYVLLFQHYICDEYIDLVLELLMKANSKLYYVNMAVAWAISMCYVSYPMKTEQSLMESNLDDFTFHKAIQKICESKQISKDVKDKLRSKKRE